MPRINFDTLKKNEWVIVVDEVVPDAVPWAESSLYSSQRKSRTNGKPLKVLAVDLPFVMVEDIGGGVSAVDVRDFVLQRCSKEYVKAALIAIDEEPEERQSRLIKKGKKLKVKKDPRDCPKCGTRMVQRRVEKMAGWRHICPDCGFDKGPVENTK